MALSIQGHNKKLGGIKFNGFFQFSKPPNYIFAPVFQSYVASCLLKVLWNHPPTMCLLIIH